MIFYVTGNKGKFEGASKRLAPFNIKLEQKILENIIEPQLEDISKISLSKATQAFEIVQHPLVVNDTAWYFEALNGFPGPFMAFAKKWFSAEDLLKLMEGKENRTVILREAVTFIDSTGSKLFTHDQVGRVLHEVRGEGVPVDCVVSFREDGKSIAECKAEGLLSYEKGLWEEFGEWFSGRAGQG